MCEAYKASVIIPVYRAEKTLRRCVESILYGSESNVQVILVDDCSPDGSWAVCQALAQEYKRRVLCLQNEKNCGVSYTRNRGLKHAQAEYVMFVDSDDWVSGDYVRAMLELAKRDDKALAVCGYTFIDLPNKCRREYLYSENGLTAEVFTETNPFELEKRVLIQQLWNKVFMRSVIEEHGITFDEHLSMGEDFLFVLDYLEATGIRFFAILNRPLYYYLRHNSHSLMSTWLDMPFEERIKPYYKMAKMIRDKELVQKETEQIEERVRNNILYQIALMKNSDRAKKEKMIARHIQHDADRIRYRKIRLNVMKERLYSAYAQVRRIPARAKAKINREYLYPGKLKKLRTKLKAKEFSLICQNCIGGVFYHEMGMQFLSPTINLYIREPDFVRFVSSLDDYLRKDLVISWEEEYPVGHLGDIRIDFMHYDTCMQAQQDWERRKARVLRDRIVVIATDRNGFDEACFEQWKRLSYKKVLFTANPAFAREADSVFFPECQQDGFVDNIIDRKAFYRQDVIFDVINSLDHES